MTQSTLLAVEAITSLEKPLLFPTDQVCTTSPARIGFRVQGSGSRVQESEFRVQVSGFRIQGSDTVEAITPLEKPLLFPTDPVCSNLIGKEFQFENLWQ